MDFHKKSKKQKAKSICKSLFSKGNFKLPASNNSWQLLLADRPALLNSWFGLHVSPSFDLWLYNDNLLYYFVACLVFIVLSAKSNANHRGTDKNFEHKNIYVFSLACVFVYLCENSSLFFSKIVVMICVCVCTFRWGIYLISLTSCWIKEPLLVNTWREL